MKTAIIACKTIKEELAAAMEREKVDLPVYWLESGLHNQPKRLHNKLQETVDLAIADGYDCLLMGFGFCGNSMDKLDSKSARIILPRVDDCISMMLGSVKRRLAIQSEKGTYFMTKGWLDGERNMYVEYKYTIDKYGEEMGEEIFDMMFGNYKRIGILDTKCYDMQPVEEETSRIAKLLKLEWEVFEASAAYLQKLVSGSWDPKLFLDIAPGTVLQLSDLRMMDED